MSEIAYSSQERLAGGEYLEFLTRTDLGGQYPRERFRERMERMLSTVNLQITARSDGRLIGVCNGLTDFAYFLFLTDLGVDRTFQRQGIGRRLVELAREAAGGADDITLLTMSHSQARGFYERCGLQPMSDIYGEDCRRWQRFDVRDLAPGQ